MFLDEDFLLTTEISKKLFHHYAKNMPIIDYHCHLNPKEIYENKPFENITQAWLTEGNHYGDHYKWRLMRANGVDESYITGDRDDYEKFFAFASTMEKAVGNPVFEWCHLELRRYFDATEILNTKTAPYIWKKVNEQIRSEQFSRKKYIQKMNVKALSTTDDPIDDLHYHELLASEEEENGFKVIPGFRPDKALNIQLPTFVEYISQLGKAVDKNLECFEDIVNALQQRIQYFSDHGCNICDHALDEYTYVESSADKLDDIVRKALKQESLTDLEVNQYKTALLIRLMSIYYRFDWTVQFHIHAMRNLNTKAFQLLGPDTGFDAISDTRIATSMANLLDQCQQENILPRVILYSLNQNDWMQLLTVMGCFQGKVKQRIQFGTAWWFNDTRTNMRKQLTLLMEQSLLGNFIGMLTDSRSFLSYPRHEYFRRVLCELLGEMVGRGQLPDDEEWLGKMVQDISFNNSKNYFKFLE